MPTDLTGTPTSLGIGTYNTSVDAPSGLGFNEAMAQIDALIAARSTFDGPGDPVTGLPGSPTDGQQAILTDSTAAPTYAWLMQYSAAAGKWLFIGGSELLVQNAGPSTTTSTVYVDTAGLPSLVVPRAGVYVVEFGARITGNNAGASTIRSGWIAPKIGAAATSDNDAAVSADSNGGTYNSNVTVSRKLSKTFAASDICKLQIRTDSATTQMAWWNAWLSIRPVAVS